MNETQNNETQNNLVEEVEEEDKQKMERESKKKMENDQLEYIKTKLGNSIQLELIGFERSFTVQDNTNRLTVVGNTHEVVTQTIKLYLKPTIENASVNDLYVILYMDKHDDININNPYESDVVMPYNNTKETLSLTITHLNHVATFKELLKHMFDKRFPKNNYKIISRNETTLQQHVDFSPPADENDIHYLERANSSDFKQPGTPYIFTGVFREIPKSARIDGGKYTSKSRKSRRHKKSHNKKSRAKTHRRSKKSRHHK